MLILFYAIIDYQVLSISLKTLCRKNPESFNKEWEIPLWDISQMLTLPELQETHVVGISIVDKHFSHRTKWSETSVVISS